MTILSMPASKLAGTGPIRRCYTAPKGMRHTSVFSSKKEWHSSVHIPDLLTQCKRRAVLWPCTKTTI